jgi:hypothetical protein
MFSKEVYVLYITRMGLLSFVWRVLGEHKTKRELLVMTNLFGRILVRVLNTRCLAVLFLSAHPVYAQSPIFPHVSVWTNRTGETIAATPLSITNQTVVMTLPSGRSKGLPLRIFPESEQVRIQLALGVASVPSCVVPAWRLFEGQLSSARDAESARASLGFIVKQLKTQADGNAISSTELTYWIARATEKERAARLELLEKIAQSGHLEKVSAVQQTGKE